jgi:thiopeptide-type bacteriocin biosynthesis protein
MASFAAVQMLRHSWELPRWIVLQQDDNTLPVDLDNPLSVDSLVHVLRRSPSAILQEMWPTPEDLCVYGPEGSFYHELVVPFVRYVGDGNSNLNITPPSGSESTVVVYDRRERFFPPGSEWFYLKVYGGVAALDEALRSVIPSIIQTATEKGIISQWFFVRYADPRDHLRLRFKGCQDRLMCDLTPLLRPLTNLLAVGHVSTIQLDTYQREIERYGGIAGIQAAEAIFFADSTAVLAILSALDSDDGLGDRWRIALLGIDRLLEDCGFNQEEKLRMARRLCDSFDREFRTSSYLRTQLGARFRRERGTIEALLAGEAVSGSAFEAASRAYQVRSGMIRESLQKLDSLQTISDFRSSIQELATSYVHMHVNRLIRSAARRHELVLYNFLYRLYDARRGRFQNAQSQSNSATEWTAGDDPKDTRN